MEGERRMDERGFAYSVWRYVGSWPERPGAVSLFQVGKEPPQLSVRLSGGTAVRRRFIDGGVIAQRPFVVLARVDGRDTAGRLSAISMLDRLHEWMRDGVGLEMDGAEVLGVEMASEPVQVGAHEDGSCDFEALFYVVYKA